jgi:hypothetical protein
MIGFPQEIRTKQDFLNAVAYTKVTGEGRAQLINTLERIRASVTMMELKDSSWSFPPEKQKQKDYVATLDPNSFMVRLGLSVAEIDNLIKGLKDV